jgi:hypothetical protein
MKKVRRTQVLRPVAWLMAALCLLLWTAPPAAAIRRTKEEGRRTKTQTPDAEHRQEIARKQASEQPEVRELSAKEMASLKGRGPYRNASLSGTMPWHRTLRDVNLSTGNLFKSFTDIQVRHPGLPRPRRRPGLAAHLQLQRCPRGAVRGRLDACL